MLGAEHRLLRARGERLGEPEGVEHRTRRGHHLPRQAPILDGDIEVAHRAVAAHGAPARLCRDKGLGGGARAHDEVGDAARGRGVALHGVGALVGVVMPGEDHVHAVLLEHGRVHLAELHLGAVLRRAGIGRVVEEDDLPGLPGGSEIRGEPGPLSGLITAALGDAQREQAAAVQGDDVRGAPVERVVALGAGGVVGRQVEVVHVRLGLVRQVLVVAGRGVDGHLGEEGRQGLEQLRLVLRVGAVVVGPVPQRQEEMGLAAEDGAADGHLGGSARAEVAHGREAHASRAGRGGGGEAQGLRRRAAGLDGIAVLRAGPQSFQLHHMKAARGGRRGEPGGVGAQAKADAGHTVRVRPEGDQRARGRHGLQVGSPGQPRCLANACERQQAGQGRQQGKVFVGHASSRVHVLMSGQNA